MNKNMNKLGRTWSMRMKGFLPSLRMLKALHFGNFLATLASNVGTWAVL